MTYPPGSPGYPPAQSPGSYAAPAAPSFNKGDEGESHLKHYLTVGVAVLGLVIYLVSYAPLTTNIRPDGEEVVVSGSTLPISLIILAALLAGASLLPKAKNYAAPVAVIAILGGLLLIEDTISASGVQRWGLWVAVASAVIQAALAVGALLLDAGVITPPAPRPKYDQYYGQYSGYYGQHQPPYGQSGYGTQYGGYPSGPTTGGFSAQPGPQQSSAQSQHGSPTPPTGFPSFSPPPASGSGAPGQGNSSDQGGSAHGQHSFGSGQQPPAPSSPSGPS